jgi:hypothetical protein
MARSRSVKPTGTTKKVLLTSATTGLPNSTEFLTRIQLGLYQVCSALMRPRGQTRSVANASAWSGVATNRCAPKARPKRRPKMRNGSRAITA